ncbi:hypothetical protein C8A05DRAFT_20084, partial [Staphylotrichum tortipilum]
DTMIVMDVASFHETDAVRARLQKELPVMIPRGLTCLLQPLDTAVNSIFKKLLRDTIDEYITTWEKEHPGQAWAVRDKRIMTTHVVAKVWQRVCVEKLEIVKSFIDTGIAIRPDGPQDLINIKGIPNSSLIWDGWEEAVDVTIKMEDHKEIPTVLDDLVGFHSATEDVSGPGQYSLLAKGELVILCRHCGLKVSGNKASLIERLRAQKDQSQGAGSGQDQGQDQGAGLWLRSTFWWGIHYRNLSFSVHLLTGSAYQRCPRRRTMILVSSTPQQARRCCIVCSLSCGLTLTRLAHHRHAPSLSPPCRCVCCGFLGDKRYSDPPA